MNGFQFTEDYVLGPGGEELTQFSGRGGWERTNVYVAGTLLGTYDMVGQPALHFHFTDAVGTRRMQVSGNLINLGQPEQDRRVPHSSRGILRDEWVPLCRRTGVPCEPVHLGW